MGTFKVTLQVGDPQGRRFTPVDALVDTGATYATLPASLLRGLGVTPHERAPFELADGRIVERDVGRTWVRIDGQSDLVPVVFGDEGAEPLLGAVTLEVFRLAVDPVRQRLVSVPGLLKTEARPLENLEMMVNLGPQHPSTHGVFRAVLWVDGERIVEMEPHIGYLHRGSEKLSEGELYHQIITLFDRLDYIANFNNELAFCMAVEKLMGVEVPELAEYVRVILCELNRVASHFLFYGTFGLDAGAMTPVMYGFRERERIQRLFEAVSGARMMHNYFRIGGIKEVPPADFAQRVADILPDLEQGLAECDRLLTQNEVFVARTRNVGVISQKQAIALAMSGPSLRSTGIPYDIRVVEPYSVYNRFEFDIPVGHAGDSWDRYAIRVEEIRQSLRILHQALEQLPDGGPIMAPGVRRLPRPPKGEVYVRTESPRGEFGVYIVSNGDNKPYRVKVRAPSFANLQSLGVLLRDAYIADAVIILGSLDIVLGEVDR